MRRHKFIRRKEDMNILIAINSNYLKPAQAMLTSLFINNTEFIDVYLLYSKLEQSEIEMLKSYIERYNAKLNAIYIDKKEFKDFPISHHFTIETYYRFLAQSVLPNRLDRILWLDADMIVNNSLKEFYYQEFMDNYVVVCQSINKNPDILIKKLELPIGSRYFNAGTILFNLDLIRRDINPRSYFDYVQQNREKITWLDQDVLNVIFNLKAKFDDYRLYNMQFFSEEKFDKETLDKIKDKTAIIHYIGNCKPWNFRYQNKLYKEYWKYARKSEGNFTYVKFIILKKIYKYSEKIRKVFKG